MNKGQNETMTNVLGKMYSSGFSTDEFFKALRLRGVSENTIKRHGSKFLKANAVKTGRRAWRLNQKELFENNVKTNETEAIDLLKGLGYKILKPVSDFVEI